MEQRWCNTGQGWLAGGIALNLFLRAAYKLGLVEDVVTFEKLVPVPSNVMYIPAGAKVEGQIHTELPIVVAGCMEGTLNVRGDADLIVLDKGEINNGLVSANNVEIHGTVRNARLDVNRLNITKTGKVIGKTQVRYDKISLDVDAPIEGHLSKRKSSRDGWVHIARPIVDALEGNSDATTF